MPGGHGIVYLKVWERKGYEMLFEEFDAEAILGKEHPHCEGCKPDQL
jgi:hypothetical protein